MSYEWFSRRAKRRWPFFRGWYSEDIDEMIEEMERMMEEEFKDISGRVPKDLVRERKLPDGSNIKEWGPFVYGYSMTIGPDGKPQVREFGNIKPGGKLGRPELQIKEEREPLIETLTTNGEVKVIAELPGVEKDDIKLNGTETTLLISVDIPSHKYFKEVDLPAKVDPKKARSTYKNGILEVTLPKKEEGKPQGEPINIE